MHPSNIENGIMGLFRFESRYLLVLSLFFPDKIQIKKPSGISLFSQGDFFQLSAKTNILVLMSVIYSVKINRLEF